MIPFRCDPSEFTAWSVKISVLMDRSGHQKKGEITMTNVEKMKIKTVKTSVLEYADKIKILIDEYENGNLYIGLFTTDGEEYCDITTFIHSLPFPFGYVEIDSEAERFVVEQGIGTSRQIVHGTTWKQYRLYEFNV